MIIITGCDNTGKTTLAEHLSDKFNIPIAKRYPELPPRDADDYYRYIKNEIEKPGIRIYDRFLLDELVYGPVIRGGMIFSVEQMSTLVNMLLLKSPLVICTELFADDIVGTFGERKQYIKMEEVKTIMAAFNNMFWNNLMVNNFEVLTFNYMINKMYLLEDNVRTYIERIERYGECIRLSDTRNIR